MLKALPETGWAVFMEAGSWDSGVTTRDGVSFPGNIPNRNSARGWPIA